MGRLVIEIQLWIHELKNGYAEESFNNVFGKIFRDRIKEDKQVSLAFSGIYT